VKCVQAISRKKAKNPLLLIDIKENIEEKNVKKRRTQTHLRIFYGKSE